MCWWSDWSVSVSSILGGEGICIIFGALKFEFNLAEVAAAVISSNCTDEAATSPPVIVFVPNEDEKRSLYYIETFLTARKQAPGPTN